MISKRSLFIALSFAPTAWLACSSSAPSVSDQNVDIDVTSKADAATSDAGKTTTADGGDAGSTKDSGSSSDAAIDRAAPDAAADSGQVVGTFGDAVCDPATIWGAGALLAASTSSDDVLDSITPDELSIAWSAGAVVQYADRASTGDAFSAPQIFDAASLADAGTSSSDRVALSPDGLRIVVVNADRSGFSEATRADRSSSFGAFTTDAFVNINAATPSGASVGDPLIAASDGAFYYSLYNAGSTSTVYRAFHLLPTEPWGEGAALNVASGLLAQGSLRRRPSGISSDSRTLFFYDEVSSTERAAWINETTGAYDSFADLGARAWAAPSSACTTLYYSSSGGSSIDLFTAIH